MWHFLLQVSKKADLCIYHLWSVWQGNWHKINETNLKCINIARSSLCISLPDHLCIHCVVLDIVSFIFIAFHWFSATYTTFGSIQIRVVFLPGLVSKWHKVQWMLPNHYVIKLSSVVKQVYWYLQILSLIHVRILSYHMQCFMFSECLEISFFTFIVFLFIFLQKSQNGYVFITRLQHIMIINWR